MKCNTVTRKAIKLDTNNYSARKRIIIKMKHLTRGLIEDNVAPSATELKMLGLLRYGVKTSPMKSMSLIQWKTTITMIVDLNGTVHHARMV